MGSDDWDRRNWPVGDLIRNVNLQQRNHDLETFEKYSSIQLQMFVGPVELTRGIPKSNVQ